MTRDARDQLILAHLEWARRTVLLAIRRRRILIDPDDAVAAGAVALVEAAGRYVPGGRASFVTFAHQRIVGAVLDLSRALSPSTRGRAGRRYHGAAIPIEDVDQGELVDRAPGPAELAEAGEKQRRVRQLLALAEPRERAVLEVVYLEDLPLTEAARRLGVSESRACQLAKAGLTSMRAGRRGLAGLPRRDYP